MSGRRSTAEGKEESREHPTLWARPESERLSRCCVELREIGRVDEIPIDQHALERC